jgi:hypothetical protein
VQPKSTAQETDGSPQVSGAANPNSSNVTAIGGNGQTGSGQNGNGQNGNGQNGNGQNGNGQNGNEAAVGLVSSSGALNPTGVTLQAATGDNVSELGVGPVAVVVDAQLKNKELEISGTNELANGWSYQTFGVWVTGEEVKVGSAVSATLGESAPTAGSAALVGNALGPHTSGIISATLASMAANVDLSQRAIGSVTSGTAAASLNGGGVLNATGLSLSGTLVNSPGTNSLGGVASAVNSLTGATVGSLPGPTVLSAPTLTQIGGTNVLGKTGATLGGVLDVKR